MRVQFGQYPAPGHVVAHFSDPHLLADGGLQYGAVDPEPYLRLALARLERLEIPPQALVFTGDLADKAEPAAYARLRELVEPLAERFGAEVVWVMGNHDERAPYAAGLFGSDDDGPQDRVHDVDGLRIIALDTSVPGYHHGDLTKDQLRWLGDVLATPAPHGTLLALHHPPIPVPMLPAAEIIELVDQHLLADVIAGTDVRGILGGHFHFSSYSTFAGVPGVGGIGDLLHLRPGAARAVHLRRRRPPVGDHAPPLRRPDRALDRAGHRGAGGQRLPERRTRPGRGAQPRGPPGDPVPQGLAVLHRRDAAERLSRSVVS